APTAGRDGRRCHALPSPRCGRDGVALRDADPGMLGAGARPESARVSVRHLGAGGSGSADRGRRPTLEEPMRTLATSEFVPLAEVERELRRQRQSLQGTDQIAAQLVRMSNLVIFCQSQESAQAVAALVPEVVTAHPARVLLLIGEPTGEGTEVT